MPNLPVPIKGPPRARSHLAYAVFGVQIVGLLFVIAFIDRDLSGDGLTRRKHIILLIAKAFAVISLIGALYQIIAYLNIKLYLPSTAVYICAAFWSSCAVLSLLICLWLITTGNSFRFLNIYLLIAAQACVTAAFFTLRRAYLTKKYVDRCLLANSRRPEATADDYLAAFVVHKSEDEYGARARRCTFVRNALYYRFLTWYNRLADLSVGSEAAASLNEVIREIEAYADFIGADDQIKDRLEHLANVKQMVDVDVISLRPISDTVRLIKSV